ncbi:MAG: thiamine diphosphokinase [Granulosicoccus sp.]|nr:thiamine diphosphokinase [Granulosicoccus sp.]
MAVSARAWVFAGGDFFIEHVPFDEMDEHDQIICVDGGVAHCLAAGLQPTLLVGDFDSVDSQLLAQESLADVPRRTYPTCKAASDLELALELLTEDPPESVIILGISGGRTDHMLFNWMLPALRHWPFSLMLIDGTTCCRVLQGQDKCEFRALAGTTISLLAQVTAMGVSTSGLQYTLADATLDIGSTRGLSNVVHDELVSVKLDSGTLLVLINNDENHDENHDERQE